MSNLKSNDFRCTIQTSIKRKYEKAGILVRPNRSGKTFIAMQAKLMEIRDG